MSYTFNKIFLLNDITWQLSSDCVSLGFNNSCCLLGVLLCTVVETFKSDLDLIDSPFGFDRLTFFRGVSFVPREVFDLAKGFITGSIIVLLLIHLKN